MSSFSYDENIPQANDIIAQSQSQILQNFMSIDGIINVDHYTFESSGSTDGYHRKSTYVAQGSDPGSASGQIVEYSKSSSGSTEIFIQRDGNATAIQLTKGTVNISGDVTSPGSKGHTFIPGGMIMQWGTVTATTGGASFTFDTSFNSIFAITMAIQASGAQSCAFASVTTSGATAYSQSGNQTINYIAIGT